MQVQPYLSFEGRADEAIEFYKKALGAEVTMLMRVKDAPKDAGPGCGGGPSPAPDKVMHAELRIGDTTIFVSDGRCQGPAKFEGIALSLAVTNEQQAQRAFAGLSDGGKVCMPLGKTFFASSFGMVNDRFGVLWMVIATPERK